MREESEKEGEYNYGISNYLIAQFVVLEKMRKE